jgi:histone acetyltransferase (RNA polymerase elongator complex component)
MGPTAARQVLVPLFLPHQGCDQRCIYCDQSSITGTCGKEDIVNQIEAGLSGRTEPVEIALYSGNIFGIPVGNLAALFDVLERYRPLISSIRISTKPVPLSGQTVQILKDAGVRVIELGMPSFNDRILASLNRGYTTEEFYRSYHYLEREGFVLGLQVMVGLPGETEADLKSTASHLSALRPSLLRIYPLVVLKGTELHRLHERGDFGPLEIDKAVQRTAFLYRHALQEGIRVIRMGLSGSEVLQEHIIAGPYHPSFGFLVKAYVFMEAITKAWEALGKPASLHIRLNSKDIPHLTGHKRSHMDRFKQLGVQLSWETAILEEGRFVAQSESGRVEGSIQDGQV